MEPKTAAGVKKLNGLRKGDIIYMRIPFEENTPDYYNGYHPKEIRGGRMYKDRFGDTSKPRFVVVIGHDDSSIIYCSLTSRHSRFDSKHQYMLQDNSMTWKKSPDMKSYVEVDSIRAVYVNPDWDFQYVGRADPNDMANIMSRAGRREIDFGSRRDQRGYISRTKEVSFERRLSENGYVLSDEKSSEKEKVYIKEDGRTVTKSRYGLVKYHVPLSKEEVTELVAKREGKPVDSFTRAVTEITERWSKKESEAWVAQ